MTIRIQITRERFEEIVSIDDEMHFGELTRKEAYDYMTQFVVDEKGNYIAQEDARKLFKKVSAKELPDYITQFYKAINGAFVNPTNGATSDEQSSQE